MENGEHKKFEYVDFKSGKNPKITSTNWKKKLMLIQNGTTLLFVLTKPHTMTIMSPNRSTWVNGIVVCRSPTLDS